MNFLKVLLFVFSAVAVTASTLTDDLTNSATHDSSQTTLVWNHALGYIHPSLSVTGILDPSSAALPDKDFPVGNGIYGAFNSSTYSRFSTGGDVSGNIIRLDTTVYESLDVTSFTLDAGWTLAPSGSKALVIRSLSTVTIAGIIECSGAAGEAMGADTTHIALGGTGRCGGGNGGNGGTATATPAPGTNSGAILSGGAGGISVHVANGGDGGGGGGALGNGAAGNGVSPSAAADAAGGASSDNFNFTNMTADGKGGAGGGGGGGGFAFAQGTADDSNGGGGGGGGGSVHIFAVGNVRVLTTGGIRAYGGAGGGGAGTLKGGGGGGGGGGSILIFSKGRIDMDANDIVDANFGAMGATAGTGGDGGVGSIGRTWLAWGGAGMVSGNERPVTPLQGGFVTYKVASQVAVSTTYDLGNTTPRMTGLSAVSSLAGGSTVTLLARGSNDNFVSDDTGWVSASSATIQGKRYVKFQATLNNLSGTNLSSIESVSFDFEGGRRDSYSFISACGSSN